jgi:hypothetical protein
VEALRRGGVETWRRGGVDLSRCQEVLTPGEVTMSVVGELYNIGPGPDPNFLTCKIHVGQDVGIQRLGAALN